MKAFIREKEKEREREREKEREELKRKIVSDETRT